MTKHLTLGYLGVLLGLLLPAQLSKPYHGGLHFQTPIQIQKVSAQTFKQASTLEKVPTTCQDYRNIISQYDWDANIAAAIMKAESNCNPDAVGDTWPINGVLAASCGLFQVRTISEWRGTCEQLKQPSFNIEKAYRVYKGQGWEAWSVFNNGAYRSYL